jgi:hypothetical protein
MSKPLSLEQLDKMAEIPSVLWVKEENEALLDMAREQAARKACEEAAGGLVGLLPHSSTHTYHAEMWWPELAMGPLEDTPTEAYLALRDALKARTE